MAHYGSDFSEGRFSRRPNSFGGGHGGYGGQGGFTDEQARGYDAGYGSGRGLSGAQGAGWYGWGGDRTARRGWDDYPGGRSFHDRHEGGFGPGRGQHDFGNEGWQGFDRSGSTGFDRYGSGFRSPGYGRSWRGERGFSSGAYQPDREWMSRGYVSRDSQLGSRAGHDYDQDFGDRVRRGWNRFRDEARSWMGRGYDRGW